MARYYYLLIGFHDQTVAKRSETWLLEKGFSIASGVEFRCRTAIWSSDHENLFWLMIEPEGVSISSQTERWVQNSEQLDQVADALYQTLMSIEKFACAIVGWEVADLFLPDATRGYADMQIAPNAFSDAGWHGLVISESLWTAIDKNKIFQSFCDGYVWQPYRTLSVSGW